MAVAQSLRSRASVEHGRENLPHSDTAPAATSVCALDIIAAAASLAGTQPSDYANATRIAAELLAPHGASGVASRSLLNAEAQAGPARPLRSGYRFSGHCPGLRVGDTAAQGSGGVRKEGSAGTMAGEMISRQ